MNRSEEKDPTCIIKMLDDFRSSSSSRRSVMGGRALFPFGMRSISTKPTKLNFDDSFSLSQNESGPSKKLKLGEDSLDSVDSSKASESSVMGKLVLDVV